MYFTYIVRCKDNSLYTGYTSDIVRRMNEHKKGINSKYTRAKGFEKLEVFFECTTRSKAMKLECFIKKLNRNKKLWLISNPDLFIDELEDKEGIISGVINNISL